MTQQKSALRRSLRTAFDYISSIFLSGLFTVLPITLTIMLINLTFRFLKSWLEPIHDLQPEFLQNIPHSEFFLVILFILVMGMILKFFILRSLIHHIESLVFKLPLIRPLYSGFKQLVNALSQQNKQSFQQIAIVEFPRKGLFSIGFVTGSHPYGLIPNNPQKILNIFVPTTPNPTSGFYIMAPEEEVIITDLTRQEAMALIMSGGIIQPERLKQETN